MKTGCISCPSENRNPYGYEAFHRVFSTLAYDATVIWCENRKPAIVIGLDREPLIGMSLLWNSDIAMAVWKNGPVSITAPAET